MKLSVLGGGNLGGAIAYGAVIAHKVIPKNLNISHCSDYWKKQFEIKNYPINCTKDNKLAIQDADIILIAVKPWKVKEVLEEITDVIDPQKQIMVSVVAGLSFKTIASYLNRKDKVTMFTVIPNTAIAVNESTTFINSNNASEDQICCIVDLFNAMGKTFLVKESQMGAYVSLSSCGIAYALKYIDAAIKGGVEMGIDSQKSIEVILQTIEGALALLHKNNTLPQIEIDKVATPGGITLKGLEVMEKNGFTNAVIQGLKASL